MQTISRHFTRCVLAGIVALLPLGGAVLTFLWLEGALSDLGLRGQPFYFPGLGILVSAAAVYVFGLLMTTFFGRWLMRRVDRVIEGLPLVGMLYDSLKELLGYDTRKERFFQEVVLVDVDGGQQLGLVTGRMSELDCGARTLVFVPGSPNPTNGRLMLLADDQLVRLPADAADVLRTLVAMSKHPLPSNGAAG